MKEFKNKGDVLEELKKIAIESERCGFWVGEAIYYDSFSFANHSDIVDAESQALIKGYLYCKETGTSPFDNLMTTPASFVDKYMIIRDELNYIHNLEIKEQSRNVSKN